MNKITRIKQAAALAFAVISTCLLCSPSTLSAAVVWNGTNNLSATTNWSDTLNWVGGSPGGADVQFFNTGTLDAQGNPVPPGTVNNVVDGDVTINSLIYAETNGAHTTLIPDGVTLNVNGGGGKYGLAAGTLGAASVLAQATNVIIGHGTVDLSNSGDLVVCQGAAQDDAHNVVLDMSGLDTFIMNGPSQGFIAVAGGGNYNGTSSTRGSGTLYLAKTNLILMKYNFRIGDVRTANAQNLCAIYLGQTNSITLGNNNDDFSTGFAGNTNLLAFAPGLTSPTLYVRSQYSVTAPRVPTWIIGNAGQLPCVGTNDFTGGIIDVMANDVRIGRAAIGASPALGVLTFDGGTFDANTIENGWQTISAGGTGVGIINVNSNAVNGTHGTLVVNGSLMLGDVTGTLTSGSSGTLNINGGVVLANNIVAGAGDSAVNINGGLLVVSNAIGAAGAIGGLALADSSLEFLSASGSAPVASVESLATGGATNLVSVDFLPVLVAYPTSIPLIQYSSQSGAFNIGIGSLPASSPAYTGYITNDTSSDSVNLVITGGPALARNLAWTGLNGSAWDIDNSQNWTADGVNSTVYMDTDFVTFDDTAHTGTVTLGAQVSPGSITVSNNTVNYTFNDTGGYLSGPGGLTKDGSGTLVMDDNGDLNDFSGGVTILAGTVQVGNSDGNGNLGTGPVANGGALIFDRNTSLAVSNAISGSGTLTQQGSAVLQLSGTNTFTGAVTVASGTLQLGNASALGTTDGGTVVANGATLDLNGFVSVSHEPIMVSGTGVGGSGAIINNAGVVSLASVTLAGDTLFGGTTRWNLYSDTGLGVLSTGGHTYNLTSAGSYIAIKNVNVDTNLANINIQSGSLEYSGTTTGLGDTNGTLTIGSSATFVVYSPANTLNKKIVMSDSSILNNGNGNNTLLGPVTLNGVGVFNLASNTKLTLNGTMAGPGTLYTSGGAGTLLLNGDGSSFTGSAYLVSGKLVLNNVLGGSGIIVSLSTTLAGNGVSAGYVDVYGSLLPGDDGVIGTFAANNGLNLESGSALKFDLTSTNTPGGGVNDLIQVTGNLSLDDGVPITINPVGAIQKGKIYTLFTYTGNFSGNLLNPVQTSNLSRYNFALTNDTSTMPKTIGLIVTGGPDSLVWNNNAGNGLWDNGSSQNWSNGVTSVSPDVFYQYDSVLLDDSIETAANPNTILTLGTGVNVEPGILTVNSSTNYTIGGAGAISGAASIVKQGSSTLTISNANTFTGNVTVKSGTLHIANANALGAAGGSTFITNNTTLDIDGVGNVSIAEPVVVSGAGLTGEGAILNHGAGDINGFKNVTLAGDTTFGGPVTSATANWGRWDIRGGSLSTSGNAYNLTKVGSNQVSIVGSTVDTNLGNITVNGGILGYETTTTGLGNPTNTLTVNPSGLLQFWNATVPLDKVIILNGADGNQVLRAGQGHQEDGENIIAGSSVTINGGVIVGFGGQNGGDDLTIMSPISGSGSLEMQGAAASEFRLYGTNTYTGDTRIDTGLMLLVNNGSISDSSNILVAAGASLIVTNRTDGTLTLNESVNQTLRGGGTVQGIVDASNGNVAPGDPSGTVIGTLTISSNIMLGGIVTMEIDNAGPSNDKLVSTTGTIALGGNLIVTNIGNALVDGDAFDLFDGLTTGSFASVTLPALDSGLTWDTSQLNSAGIIKVVSATVPQPHIVNIILSGSNLVLSGTNGAAGEMYYLLESTNIALPLSQWTPIATNTFEGSDFSITNMIDSGAPQAFYLLKVP